MITNCIIFFVGVFMNLAGKLRQWRVEKKLESAIIKGDLDSAHEALEEGARKVNHSQFYLMNPRGNAEILVTQDPVELVSYQQFPAPGLKELLKEELVKPAPELPETTLFKYISEEISGSLKERHAKRLCKMLSNAILKKDPEAIQAALDRGATEVDMTRSAQTGYGDVPLERIKDPIEFAGRIGLADKEGKDILISRLRPSDPTAQGNTKPSL